MTTRSAITPEQAGRLAEWIEGLTPPFTITMKEGVARTIPQNSLLHVWFEQISKHFGDTTPAQVKGDCHFKWGLSIRLRDPQFAWIWNESAAPLSEERQRKVLSTKVFSVSSGMEKTELTEYMNEIEQFYAPQGVMLKNRKLNLNEAAA